MDCISSSLTAAAMALPDTTANIASNAYLISHVFCIIRFSLKIKHEARKEGAIGAASFEAVLLFRGKIQVKRIILLLMIRKYYETDGQSEDIDRSRYPVQGGKP
jgi:hypothetical protein